MTVINLAGALVHYPLGTVFTDKHGDVWMIDTRSGVPAVAVWMVSPETGHFPASDVIRKWGPLTLQWRPLQPPRAMRRPPVDTLGYALLADASRPPSLAFAVHETAGEAEAHRVQTLNPGRWRIVALMEVPNARDVAGEQ
ncbi:MAG: hypothetical protein QM804_10215 [Propionicimonas sp.]